MTMLASAPTGGPPAAPSPSRRAVVVPMPMASVASSGAGSMQVRGDQAARLREMVEGFHQGWVGVAQAAPSPTGGLRLASHPPRSAPPAEMPRPRSATGAASVSGSTSVPVRTKPIIAITSGKGGVGKTSVAVNLCAIFAQRGARAMLIDADPGLANADVLCGLSPARRLDAVLGLGTRRAEARTISIGAPGGFALVPGSVGSAAMANLPSGHRAQLIANLMELQQQADVLVIDTGAGLSENVLDFVRLASLAVIVATPEPTSIADAYATIKLLRRGSPEGLGIATPDAAPPAVGLVINMARDQHEADRTFARIAGTCERFLRSRPASLGWLPMHVAVPTAVRQRVPLVVGQPDASIVTHLQALADRCAGDGGLALHKPSVAPRTWLRRVLGLRA